jgi:hypothetical protein
MSLRNRRFRRNWPQTTAIPGVYISSVTLSTQPKDASSPSGRGTGPSAVTGWRHPLFARLLSFTGDL